MIIIRKGRTKIIRIWGEQTPKDVQYRLIRYHLRNDCEDGTLLYNVVTGELALLSWEEAAKIASLPVMRDPVLDELIRHRFLVPETFDETKSVDQLRKILSLTERKTGIRGYCILPTTGCNARCFYCYESGMRHLHMSEETAHKTVDYIAAHKGDSGIVSIQWFGGEPLVGVKRIDQICTELTERGVKYSSRMISNAYLFTEEMAERACSLWHLRHIQVTLDGTEDIYNRVKAYVNAEENPYQRVLRNISCLLDKGIAVTVRLNLDYYNAGNLKILVDELADRFMGRSKFSVYSHVLFDDCGFQAVHHNEAEKKELFLMHIELEKYIWEKVCLKGKEDLRLPVLSHRHCMADSERSVIINPEGKIGKCEHHIFDKLVGSIDGETFDKDMIAFWKEQRVWDNCRECALYPSCMILKHCDPKTECLDFLSEHKREEARQKILKVYEKSKKK